MSRAILLVASFALLFFGCGKPLDGITGPMGAQGEQGEIGPQGEMGPQGEPGSPAPTGSICYIDKHENKCYFRCSDGSWALLNSKDCGR